MFLNIITPCTRYQNLQLISDSINIPKSNYRWIVVFDSTSIPSINLPSNGEYYCTKNINSRFGNAQRNYAIDLVKGGHLYFNDDDTQIHPQLWSEINKCDDADFISFCQNFKNGKLRLQHNTPVLNKIDSHNFIVSKQLVGELRWILDRRNSDGIFAERLHSKAKNKIYIDKVLSVYNSLRP